MENLLANNETKNIVKPEVSHEFFTDFAEAHIHRMRTGKVLTPKKVKFAVSTIRQYNASLELFKRFESVLEGRVRVIEVSTKLMRAFELYLTQQGLAKNSISLYISKIKAIGNVLFDDEIAFRPVKYATPNETTTKIYLNLNDLRQLANSETKISASQQRVLDVFICQCFLGLRYDTLLKFLANPFAYIQNYEGNAYLDIVSDKTGEQSIVPVGETVTSIITKYSGRMPTYTEQYVNRTIKEIAEIRGLTNDVAVRKTLGGSMDESFIPKYKLISTHTARRTFVTLLRNSSIDNRKIMAMTGHKSEKQLLHYSRGTNIDIVKGIFGHEFFDTEL